MKQALQWWSEQQANQLWWQAELIRDGMLQEVFAMRRNLELSLLEDSVTSLEDNQNQLERIESLQRSLESLSSALSPLYLEESLPLAIQSMLKRQPVQRWETFMQVAPSTNLALDPKMELSQWNCISEVKGRVILQTLRELLNLTVASTCLTASPRICLSAEDAFDELTLEIAYLDSGTAIAVSKSQDLTYLSRCFRWLASGQCFYQRSGSVVKWHLRWQRD